MPTPQTTAAGHGAERRRQRLWLLTLVMTLLLGIAFVLVLFRGIGGPAPANTGSDLIEVPPGGARLDRIGRDLVWIVRFGEGDTRVLDEQSAFVQIGSPRACLTQARPLCFLEARGSSDDIPVRYVEEPPEQLPRGVPWNGGFVDPANRALYDRQGRGFRSNPQGAIPSLAVLEAD